MAQHHEGDLEDLGSGEDSGSDRSMERKCRDLSAPMAKELDPCGRQWRQGSADTVASVPIRVSILVRLSLFNQASLFTCELRKFDSDLAKCTCGVD